MEDLRPCMGCFRKIGRFERVCPYCGERKYGKNDEYAPNAESYAIARQILYETPQRPKKKKKKPMFSDTQKLMFGLYPKKYKNILKLKVFGKK